MYNTNLRRQIYPTAEMLSLQAESGPSAAPQPATAQPLRPPVINAMQPGERPPVQSGQNPNPQGQFGVRPGGSAAAPSSQVQQAMLERQLAQRRNHNIVKQAAQTAAEQVRYSFFLADRLPALRPCVGSFLEAISQTLHSWVLCGIWSDFSEQCGLAWARGHPKYWNLAIHESAGVFVHASSARSNTLPGARLSHKIATRTAATPLPRTRSQAFRRGNHKETASLLEGL